MNKIPVAVNPTPINPIIKPNPVNPISKPTQTHYASITCYKKQQLINAAAQLAGNGFIAASLQTQQQKPTAKANVDVILQGLAKMFNIVL